MRSILILQSVNPTNLSSDNNPATATKRLRFASRSSRRNSLGVLRDKELASEARRIFIKKYSSLPLRNAF
jgi:hypothetical protein